MCLIALAWCAHPRYRLALIANRDEAHARPTAATGFDPDFPDAYGGRDLQAGGGWLMASTRGRLAAVTNVRAGLVGETAPRSRGALVRGYVSGNTPANDYLSALREDAPDYGRFNLLAWDGDTLGFATNHPGYETHPVAPGVHAMSNGAFDASWPKSGHATRALAIWLDAQDGQSLDPAVDIDATVTAPLFSALAETTQAPDALLPETGIGLELERMLSPPFVRGARYGTRCSTVVLVGDDGIRFIERSFGPDAVALGESSRTLPFSRQ